jgi:cell division protein FtsB
MLASLPRLRPIPRRRRLWIAVAVGVCLTGVLYYGPVKSYISTSHQLAQRRAEVKSLTRERTELEQRLAISGTGPALIEEARRLGYVRPGEHLFIVRGVKEWLATHPNAPGRHR